MGQHKNSSLQLNQPSSFNLQPSVSPDIEMKITLFGIIAILGLVAMIGYSETQEPCGCGVMYCPCPGGRREFWKQSMKSLLKRSFMKLRSPKKCHSKVSNGIAVSSTFWKFLNNRMESENAAKYLESASDNSVILKHRQKMSH